MVALNVLGLLAVLLTDTAFSWMRMFVALGISVLISLAVGIYAATSERAGRIILPVIDIFQTIPIVTFFPFVILVFVGFLPGVIGINAAVVFLIITSMIWNIIFGVYEAIKAMPKEFAELARLYGLSKWQKLSKVYVPVSMPRVVEQSVLSWAIGLFYLVTSEIFSAGNTAYHVKNGIGVELTGLALSGNTLGYLLGIGIFILFVIATRLLFFKPLEDYVVRYTKQGVSQGRISTRRRIYGRVMQLRLFRYLQSNKKAFTAYLVRKGGAGRGVKWRVAKVEKKTQKRGAAYYIILAALAVIILYGIFRADLAADEYSVFLALLYSFGRVWLAFIVSLAIAIPVCVYVIFLTKKSSFYLLLFQIIASIPSTILLPEIVALMRGYAYGSELIAFIVFVLSGIWYLIFSTMHVAKSMPNNVLEVKNTFGVRGVVAWKKIYIMVILPGLITGSITAIGAEWNASIVAENFQNVHVGSGIGKFLDMTIANPGFNMSLSNHYLLLMLLALLNIIIMILLINTLVWKRLYSRVARIYG